MIEKDNDSLDLGEAYLQISEDQTKIMKLRLNLLHLLDSYSNKNTLSLLTDTLRVEKYVITGDIYNRF